MKKRSILVVVVVAALFCLPLTAGDATFKSVTGKVEYRLSANEAWQVATKGTIVPEGSDISTGFKSTAAIELNGSVMMVKALTRMSLEEIAKSSNGTTTGLYLMAGKVQVEVRPGSTAKKTEFKIKSPMSTASVRGTGFMYDTKNLLVGHGVVELKNRFGVNRNVNAGQFAAVGNQGSVAKAIPVEVPQEALLTPDGDESEIDEVVEGLFSPSNAAGSNADANFSKIKSTYGPAMNAKTMKKNPEKKIIDSGAKSEVQITIN